MNEENIILGIYAWEMGDKVCKGKETKFVCVHRENCFKLLKRERENMINNSIPLNAYYKIIKNAII